MIGALLFLVIAVALFFYALSPFFADYEPIPELPCANEMEEFLNANMNEFSADFELGKITMRELKQFEENLKKEE